MSWRTTSIYKVACLGAILVMVVGPIEPVVARSAQQQDSTELLANPNFEPPFESVSGPIGGIVASGWTAWWLTPDGVKYPTSCPEGSHQSCVPHGVPLFNHTQPQDPKAPDRSLSGDSQKWGTAYTVYIGGVYQRVLHTTPGVRYRFSAYIEGFNCDDDRACFADTRYGQYGKSYEAGDMQTRVGIDPSGDTNPFSSNIVWSAYQNPLDEFSLHQIEAVAQANSLTVYVWSSPTFPERHTDIFLDNASLIAVGRGPAPATAVPTATPGPSPTPGPTNTLAPTPTPGPTITPLAGTPTTYVVQDGDTLAGIAKQLGLTLDQIQALNDITDTDFILSGQILIVGVVTVTPTPSPTITLHPTGTPAPTATISATLVVTFTLIPTRTPAASALRTATQAPPTEELLGLTGQPALAPLDTTTSPATHSGIPTDVLVVGGLMVLSLGGILLGIRAQRK